MKNKKFNLDVVDQTLKATLAALMLAVTLTSSVLAYGPERTTYTIEKPADKVTFNSITNNPNYGDERNFVLIKSDKNNQAGGWKYDRISVDKTEEFYVRAYVHNNAAANLGLSSKNTRVTVSLPTDISKEVNMNVIVSSDNSDPKEVWDNIVFSSSKDFNVAYVAGSAYFKNNVNTNPGFKISDDLVTKKGAKIGYQSMDGVLPGCFQYSGILTFKVRVQVKETNGFEVNKTVRKSGDKSWKKSIVVEPGDKVDYLLKYKNLGSLTHDKVVLRDVLPKVLLANEESLVIKNGSHPNIAPLDKQNLIDLLNPTKGLNIGKYQGQAAAYLRFTVTIPKDIELSHCGPNIFRNTLVGLVDSIGSHKSYADVIVNKKCDPVVTKTHKLVCDKLNLNKVDDNNYKFKTNYTSENTEVKSITYTIFNKETNKKVVKTVANELDYKWDEAGVYEVMATVNGRYDGKEKSVSSEACQGEVIVPKKETETPKTLPKTGPAEMLLSTLGLILVTMAVAYWYRSETILRQKVNKK